MRGPERQDLEMRNFRHRSAKFRRSTVSASARPQTHKDFRPSTVFWAGAALAIKRGEYQVFRATLFSIVLTLAVGQNAALWCTVWCPDATSTVCPHQESTTSPSVRTTDDTCANVAVGAVAFVREDGRRTAPAPDAQNALVVLRFQLVAPQTDLRHRHESGQRMLLEERPLVIALRI